MTQPYTNIWVDAPKGRKDWDYVSMEDYTKDTQELVEQGNAIAESLREELRDIKVLFSAAIQTMGRVEVDIDMLIINQESGYVRYERPDLNKIIFEVEK